MATQGSPFETARIAGTSTRMNELHYGLFSLLHTNRSSSASKVWGTSGARACHAPRGTPQGY
jgi:hypothetical protein